MPMDILTTLVYLQLCPEAQGSRPHFPMASNEKQKPRLQNLWREDQKSLNHNQGGRIEDGSCDLSAQRLKKSETVMMTMELAEKALRKFNTLSRLNKKHHFKLEING